MLNPLANLLQLAGNAQAHMLASKLTLPTASCRRCPVFGHIARHSGRNATKSAGSRSAVRPQAASSSEQQELSPEVVDPVQDVSEAAAAATRKGTAKLLSENIGSLSFVVVGGDSELNASVTKALGKSLGWFPASTEKIILGMNKCDSMEKLVKGKGRDFVVQQEAEMLHGMRTQMRVIVGTLGFGAATRPEVYTKSLKPMVVLLVEEDGSDSPYRSIFLRHADICVRLKKSRGFAAAQKQTTDDKAATAVKLLVANLWQYLAQNPGLIEEKRYLVDQICGIPSPKPGPKGAHPLAAALSRKALPGTEPS